MICGTADCGLRYGVRRNSSAAAYCAISIGCGTRDEDGYPEGTAHFTEHTIFKGTARKRASVINGYLDRLGGELNAYTTKEDIVFHATVLREDLSKAANLLMELVTEPTFPEAEIETERGVILDEIISYKDSPADEIYDRFETMLFPGHPLGRLILGTAASVKKITPEQLRRFVKEKFTPDRMAFTAVADIEEKKMEAAVRKLCGKYFGTRAAAAPGRVLHGNVPVLTFDRTVQKRNHEANAVIGAPGPSLQEDKERLTATLLSNLVGGPASNSLLGNILREKNGWVYGVECSYTQYADTGVVAISFGCDKPAVEKCFRVIDRELRKLRDRPLSDARLKAARKQLMGQMAISSASGESQCLFMGKSLLSFGAVTPSEEVRKQFDRITAADLQEMACRVFDPDRLSRLVFL